VVVDEKNSLPRTLNIFNADAPTLVATEKSVNACLQVCYENNLQSWIVEGGARLLQKFIDAGLWDEARIFTAPLKFGKGVSAPVIAGALRSEERLGDNLLQVLQPKP
jgi:diaminohydroxyphosphoribosylaminopyrimidine deaminase/5-amino-6-(5-phosphoribosylamino)uracil reductase